MQRQCCEFTPAFLAVFGLQKKIGIMYFYRTVLKNVWTALLRYGMADSVVDNFFSNKFVKENNNLQHNKSSLIAITAWKMLMHYWEAK